MRLPRPFVQILTAIASLVTVPFAHATSGDSTPFLLDTRNYDDSTPLFSVDTRSPDLIANTGITDSGGASFTITMAMLEVTGTGAVTFTLLTGPVHGTLFLDGIAQGAGATFTQAQIDAGLLSYQRAAGDALSDTFEMAAMDDDAGLLGGNLSFAVAGIPGASGTLFLVDTRNFSGSAAHTVHTDNRAYLTVDTVPGSLRQAIANVAAGETVDFDTGLSGGTIVLGSQVTLDKTLMIDGSMLADGVTISGDDASRVFEIGADSDVSIQKLTITEGLAPGDGNGGGISVLDGTLHLTDCTVTQNEAGFLGGGIFVAQAGALELISSTVSNNSASEAGGIFLFSPATVDVTSSTITGNLSAGNGGAIINNGGTVTITSSTITGNTAQFGGGIQQDGAGSETLQLNNSIVAGNSAPTGPDINMTSGTVNATGSNLIGINTTVEAEFPASPLTGTSSEPLNVLLAPLGDYGGPTQTMALRSGSPAINAAGVTAITTDQRGFNRVGTPDIGAYESGNAAGYSVWATEMINEGMDASFTGNADEDPSANGTEYALGTGVLISDPASPHNPEVITNGSGEIEITFGFNPIAAVDTRWIIERSTDLENFTEIYRYDGPTSTSTSVAGISAVVGATSITVTDTNPPSPNVFYRFGAQTAP
jgi:hypothetical protein